MRYFSVRALPKLVGGITTLAVEGRKDATKSIAILSYLVAIRSVTAPNQANSNAGSGHSSGRITLPFEADKQTHPSPRSQIRDARMVSSLGDRHT